MMPIPIVDPGRSIKLQFKSSRQTICDLLFLRYSESLVSTITMLKVGDYVFSKTAKNDFWPCRVTQLEAATGKVCVKFVDRPRSKTMWMSSNDVVVYDPLVEGHGFLNPKMKKALDSVKKAIKEQSLST